jgi:hypothetical protein
MFETGSGARLPARISEDVLDRQFRCGAEAIGRRAKEGDLLVTVGAATPEPLTPDNVPLGEKQIMAWPMDPERRGAMTRA